MARIQKSANCRYLGKQLGEGKNVGTGKDGVEWKRFKAAFQVDGQTKPWNFTVFSPLSSKNCLQLSALEEGKEYSVFWNEEQQSYQGKEYTSKTIYFIGMKKEGQVGIVGGEGGGAVQDAKQATHPSVSGLPDLLPINTVIIDQYEKLVSPQRRDVNHMVGTYLRIVLKGLPIIEALNKEYNDRWANKQTVDQALKDAVAQEVESPKDQVLRIVRTLDKGAGADIDFVVKACSLAQEQVEAIIGLCIKNGELFEKSAGKVSILA